MSTVPTGHKSELARDLLDDIELSRLIPEALLLKARRLARLIEASEIDSWLRFELEGYPNSALGQKYMTRMGRWNEYEKKLGYWIPLAGIEGMIAAMQVQIQQLQVPNIHFAPSSSNPNEYVSAFGIANKFTEPATNVLVRLTNLTNAVSTLRSIRSRTLSALHDFATASYYELAFTNLAQSVFESHQSHIDMLLASHAPDAISKLPAIYDRLSAGDPEAVSQGLNSCRRMIKAFADAVYPPVEGSIDVDGQTYEIGADKVLNRIRLYLLAHCPSSSRRDRLNRSLRDIHERASAGSHADVQPEEARSLFLGTYLTLGEILVATGNVVPPIVNQPVNLQTPSALAATN
jgi:AbiTii